MTPGRYYYHLPFIRGWKNIVWLKTGCHGMVTRPPGYTTPWPLNILPSAVPVV